MSENIRNSEPKGPFTWLLWWMIDEKAFRKQVRQYKTLPIYASARGQSALLLLFSALLTALLVLLSHKLALLLDGAAFAVLAVFVFRGQRWALMTAMILWTLEKAFGIFSAVYSHQLITPFTTVVWWTAYMHAFYFAYRVEGVRRASPEVVLATFD